MSHATPPRRFRSRAAESMIETLIAITVLVLSTTAALSMLRTALKGNQIIGEKLVAIQLAMEGLDAIKNIRDTNYLLFPSDTDNCWNRLNAKKLSDCTSPSTPANTIYDGQTYYLTRNLIDAPLFKWSMSLASGPRPGGMNFFSIDTTTTMDSATENATLYADWRSASNADFTSLFPTSFVRTVTIDYDPLDSNGVDQCPTDECFSADVKVEWRINGLIQSVTLTRIFSNVF